MISVTGEVRGVTELQANLIEQQQRTCRSRRGVPRGLIVVGRGSGARTDRRGCQPARRSEQAVHRLHARWRFHGSGGDSVVTVEGDRVSDDGDAVRRWAVDGHGIAYKSWLDVCSDVGAGRLLALLPAWRGETAPLNLVCADRRLLSPAVQALREHLADCCAQLPPPPEAR